VSRDRNSFPFSSWRVTYILEIRKGKGKGQELESRLATLRVGMNLHCTHYIHATHRYADRVSRGPTQKAALLGLAEDTPDAEVECPAQDSTA
jgi:hypothetical protein